MKTSNSTSSRPDRVGSQIQQELGELLLVHVKDPRVRQVSLTAVRVTRDLGLARVYYLLLDNGGAEGKALEQLKRDVARGLESVTPFLRREIGQRLRLRTVPKLTFLWDDAVEHGRRMEVVFAELAASRPPEGEEGAEAGAEAGAEEAPEASSSDEEDAG